MRYSKKHTLLIIILLIAASSIAFGRIAGNDFINYDDNQYITENYNVQNGINYKSIKWALTTTYFSYWHPLTWLSHMIDWNLFGTNASGHHIISLLLHIGAVIFLFLFLYKTTNNIWPAAFAAAFFALHPLRVESIAWASERKDVLSMFFGMACIYAYAFYTEKNKNFHYFICLILFVLSLMSKPLMVTIPFILMLLDYWPLQRWEKVLEKQSRKSNSIRKLFLEKLPFICLTIFASIITFWAQNKAGIITSGESLPFIMRGANAILSYVGYLEKIFWPANLAIFYPYNLSLSLWKVFTAAIMLILITAVVLYYFKKLPFLITGWFWFLGTLIPVIGLVQVGMQAMADRYSYLPSIGIAIMLAWGMYYLFYQPGTRKYFLFTAGIAFLVLLVFLSWLQCGYWKNSTELFNHTLIATKNNYVAHNYLGPTLLAEGKIDQALYHYNEAILISPYYADAYFNRGKAYAKLDQYQLAIEDYNKAIALKPSFAEAYNNKAMAYAKLGQQQRSFEEFNKAIRLNPDYADAYNNLGLFMFNQGKIKESINNYDKAINLNPNHVEAFNNRGNAYTKMGHYQFALEDYNKAIAHKSDLAETYNNRGIVYGGIRQYQLAMEDFNKAIHLKANYAEAYNNKGFTYYNVGQYQRAIDEYNRAIRLEPDYAGAYCNRAIVYFKLGKHKIGCVDAQKACKLGDCKTLETARGIGLCY